MTSWLADGEKYALIGLEVKTEETIPFRELVSGLWAWTDTAALGLPAHWREWIGSVRAEEIEGCNLVLLAKMPSSSPKVLDGENGLLKTRVSGFYRGLLLASTFTPSHPPVLFSGSREDGSFGVRESLTLEIPSLNIFPVLSAQIEYPGRDKIAVFDHAESDWRSKALDIRAPLGWRRAAKQQFLAPPEGRRGRAIDGHDRDLAQARLQRQNRASHQIRVVRQTIERNACFN
jgi:hypothetical protein